VDRAIGELSSLHGLSSSVHFAAISSPQNMLA
jgi:hypothetical protein